jgi:hypothetical protein
MNRAYGNTGPAQDRARDSCVVIPAQAGIQLSSNYREVLDSGFRRNDEENGRTNRVQIHD